MKTIIALLLASCVVSLAQTNTNLNANDDPGVTALMDAVKAGQTDAVEFMLHNGTDINAKDTNGMTALMFAAGVGAPAYDPASVPVDPATLLPVTPTPGEETDQMKMVKLLLANGADIYAVNKQGQSALIVAMAHGNTAIAQQLQQAAEIPSSVIGTLVNAIVASGTNTDRSGYVTNAALLTPFTLTNSVGDVITNAVLVKLTPNKFIYKTPSGEMATRRLDSLSKELRDKFGYDPQTAQAGDVADEQKKERQQQIEQQKREAAARQAFLDSVLQRREPVTGKVIQKIDDGLLVSREFGYGDNLSYKTILLKDFSYYDKVAADDPISCYAIPVGNYSYKTVNDSENTVHIYTCSTDAAVEYYSTH